MALAVNVLHELIVCILCGRGQGLEIRYRINLIGVLLCACALHGFRECDVKGHGAVAAFLQVTNHNPAVTAVRIIDSVTVVSRSFASERLAKRGKPFWIIRGERSIADIAASGIQSLFIWPVSIDKIRGTVFISV